MGFAPAGEALLFGQGNASVGSHRDVENVLNTELFHRFTEIRVIIKDWRGEYNQERLHSVPGYQVPSAVFERIHNRNP
jgi:transposase InsO family protein